MILTVTANPAIDIVYFIENFQMGKVHRPSQMTYTAGGKGINVSRVAAIMGERVTAMGFAGGNNGAFIQTEIKKLGIVNMFTKIKGETRRCINIVDSTGKSGEILEAGPCISTDEENRFMEAYAANVKNHNIVCISGSLPQGLESSFYCKLIELAKENSIKILVDTSGKTLEDIIRSGPYMIKPNRDELSCFLGRALRTDDDLKAALKILYASGIAVPLVTLGNAGAMLYDGRNFYKFHIPTIKVKNTVGSGDCTVAGIAVGLCRGMTEWEAVRLGMAAGMANTQHEQTGMISTEFIEQYYHEIKAEIL